MMTSTSSLACLAVASRLLVTALAVLLHGVVRSSDASGQLRSSHCHKTDSSIPQLRGWEGTVAAKLHVWDTVHYLRVAQCGYEDEQSHAFFPLLPGLLRALAPGTDAGRMMTGLALSNVSFVISALLFQRLSRQILQDAQLAAAAALLYCFNPASMFFSAVYTESLYAMFSFAGLLSLQISQPWSASVLFSLSSATRSNGITLAWFQIWADLSHVNKLPPGQRHEVVAAALRTIACVCIIAAPVILFQMYGYWSFCLHASQPPSWCASRLPYLYGHVQSTYWNVGLLRSYQWRQAPNFLLAAPMLWLSWQGCTSHLAQIAQRCLHGRMQRLEAGSVPGAGYWSHRVTPYACHWAMMACIAALVMNIQVATRFCSTCPALYWYAAELVLKRRCRWVYYYFALYLLSGCLLFPNWFPWV